jgi:hypothetical protein
MTTELQTAANGRNATLSTGPKTDSGKVRSSKNALRYGLRSELPVLPGERAEEWDAHRDGIVQSLAPSGGLETALAERVALSLWRLRRVASYETAVTALSIEEVSEDIRQEADDPLARIGGNKPLATQLIEAERALKQARDKLAGGEGADRFLGGLSELPDDAPVSAGNVWDAFQELLTSADAHYDGSELPDAEDLDWLADLGVPEGELRDAYEWDGWTAGMVRLGWQRIAAAAQANPDKLLARVIADRRQDEAEARDRIPQLERAVKDLRRRIRTREDRLRQRRMLPDDTTLNKVTRYEAHLSRQMLQALHTLERLQAARAGQPVPPPAALDVTLEATPPLADGQSTAPGAADVA